MKYAQAIDNGLFFLWRALVFIFPFAFTGYIFTNIIKMLLVKDRYASLEDSIDFQIFIFDSVFMLGFLLCSSLLLFCFLSRKNKTLTLAKQFLLIFIGYLLLRSIIYALLTCFENGMRHLPLNFTIMFREALPQILFFGFWFLYLSKSKRAREVYTE